MYTFVYKHTAYLTITAVIAITAVIPGCRSVTESHDINVSEESHPLLNSVPRKLPEHIGEVWGLAFSPDGKLLATETDDRMATVLIWDTTEWKITHRIPQPGADGIECVRFSPDGRLLAIGGRRQPVGLWEIASGRLLHSLSGPEVPMALTFSSDGKTLAAGSISGRVYFWDVESGNEIRRMEACSPVVFSPDGKLFAAVSPSTYNEVILWSTSSWQPTITLKGHSGSVVSAQFSPDSKMVATGSMDGTARLWDAQTGKQLRRLGGHQAAVNALAFSRDGKMLATADWWIYLWDPVTGRKIRTLKGASPREALATNVVDFSPDSKLLAAGRKGVVEIWDLPVR